MSSSVVDSPLPDAYDVRAVLAFLPILEAHGFSFGVCRGGDTRDDGTIQMSYFALSDQAEAFVRALYRHHFIRPFEWRKWQDQARHYIENPAMIDQADLNTICKLLTTTSARNGSARGTSTGCLNLVIWWHCCGVFRHSRAEQKELQ